MGAITKPKYYLFQLAAFRLGLGQNSVPETRLTAAHADCTKMPLYLVLFYQVREQSSYPLE